MNIFIPFAVVFNASVLFLDVPNALKVLAAFNLLLAAILIALKAANAKRMKLLRELEQEQASIRDNIGPVLTEMINQERKDK